MQASASGSRLLTRLRDADFRAAAGITVLVTIGVFLLGNPPLRGGFHLDLREGDAVGGWNQVTLVGFSITQPFGRSLPSRPGREGLRIVSNRPLPRLFELEIEGWSLAPKPQTPLEVRVGQATHVLRFDPEPHSRRVELQNPDGERTIYLRLEEAGAIAVRLIAVREAEPRP